MLDVLENAALVYPLADPPAGALLLEHGRAELVKELFAKVSVPEKWSFGPVEGRWPDFTVLTVARRGYRGYTREANVLRKQGDAWTPLPGELGHAGSFVLLPPIAGRRLLLVDTEGGFEFRDAAGRKAALELDKQVDGADFKLTGASVDDSGQLFVSGFIREKPPEVPGKPASALDLAAGRGGGVDGGVAVVQRFPARATRPIAERLPGGELARVHELSGAGVISAGKLTGMLLGEGRALGRFENGGWTVEALRILPAGFVARNLTLARDGTVWFIASAELAERVFLVRRAPDGAYARVALPPDFELTDVYATSSADVWLVGDARRTPAHSAALFHSSPSPSLITLDAPAKPR
jgi:hypothetical protein